MKFCVIHNVWNYILHIMYESIYYTQCMKLYITHNVWNCILHIMYENEDYTWYMYFYLIQLKYYVNHDD